MQDQTIKIFIAYARKDKQMVEEVEKDLIDAKRHVGISWYSINISAGIDWQEENEKRLNSAQVILLMVSRDFLGSDYSYSNQVQQAVTRHQMGQARVIPIILRPCDWNKSPFGRLMPLPEDGKPVTKWKNRDDAYLSIKRGILEAIALLQSQPLPGNIINFPSNSHKDSNSKDSS